MPRESQKYRKCALFVVVLLLILAFLPPSHEFSFGWGGGDDSKSKEAVSADASRKALKRNVFEKKHKFHKIERIMDDDEEEEGQSENDDPNVSANEDSRDHAGEEVDDADDATKEREDEENASRQDRAASLNSANNDDEEEAYQFKRARKAGKPPRSAKNSAADDNVSQETSWFFGLFGGKDKSQEATSKQAESAEVVTPKTNGIIDWILWLGERSGRLRPPTESAEDTSAPAPDSSENWLDYFNRWPFNSLFPIGKPPKPIIMPKVAKKGRKDVSKGDEASAEPMSQESFDNLLNSLPNFIINPHEVLDEECRQQLQIFQRQLRGHKLWTLQMVDSTGKVGSGLLRGNINQFGDFNMCTDIKTMVKVTASRPVRIRGKYCLAHIETQTSVPELKIPVHMLHGRGLFNSHLGNPHHFIPRYGVANWGICVPNACSGDVVRQMLQSNLQTYNNTGVEVHIEVNDNDCYVKQSRKFFKLLKKDKKFCATVLYILGLVMLTLSTFLWEHWSRIKPMLERLIEILKIVGSAIKSVVKFVGGVIESAVEWVKGLMEKFKKKPENAEENGEKTNEDGEDKEKEEIGENKEEEQAKEAEAETAPEEETQEKADAEAEKEEETAQETTEATNGEEEDPTSENLSLNYLAAEIFKSFSPKRTLDILMASDSYDVQFPLLHVLKIGATFMLYLCLKFLMIGHMPITNRDQLVRTFDHPLSVLIRSPMIYADILLLISGFLSAYQLSEEMEQKSYIQLLKRLASKVSRYLPTVYLLVCFQTWILPYLNMGPLWTNLIGQNSRLCDDHWWRNILSVQNAIDFEETCSPSTIQLALEVQLYLLAPLLVWLYYTDSDAAFFVYGGFHAMSVAARFARTNKEHLSMIIFHGINVSKFYRTANILYSSPVSRATTYLLGIGAGIFQRSQQGIIDLTPEMIRCGWGLASMGILWSLWSPSSSMRTDYIYTSSDAASYAAWCPLVLGLSLCWFIFMLPKMNENSIIQFLSTSKTILVLSRLVFPIQLVMYIVVLYGTAKVKEVDRFHLTDLINLQEIAMILLGSIIVSFLIDIPSQNIRRLIVNRIFIERPHHDDPEHLTADGEPASEASDEASEQVLTSDTPEPSETVWGSDPEEEEKKYLNRRRSSLLDSSEAVKSETKKDEEEEEEEEVEEEEEEEVEEEEDISEAEEVKKHP